MGTIGKVMVVDDNKDQVEIIGMVLEPEGYEVVTATNGKEAKETVDRERPDFILLDVMMPEMDGLHFCSWLKSQEAFQDTPVVLLSSVGQHISDTKYTRKGVMMADADDFIEKPVRPETLLQTISKYLNK